LDGRQKGSVKLVMDFSSAFGFGWFLVVIFLAVRYGRDQKVYFAALQRSPPGRWPQDAITPLFEGTLFTLVRERLREHFSPQIDDRCEQLRRRANRSLLLFVIAAFVLPLAFMIGAVLYMLRYGPITP
jgi:hypothetical protein